jgi:arginase
MVPVGYLNRRYAGDLAVVWFDAHPDLNTPRSSPSGHFHGMVLRALLGDGDQALSDMVPRPLSPSQVILAGVRDIDEPEAAYASAVGIPIISPDELKNSDRLMDAVGRSGYSNLYVHIDLDFLNPDDFEGAQFRAAGGISYERTD